MKVVMPGAAGPFASDVRRILLDDMPYGAGIRIMSVSASS
jgi:hypothetical protein